MNIFIGFGLLLYQVPVSPRGSCTLTRRVERGLVIGHTAGPAAGLVTGLVIIAQFLLILRGLTT